MKLFGLFSGVKSLWLVINLQHKILGLAWTE
jgi:hypothetical protein